MEGITLPFRPRHSGPVPNNLKSMTHALPVRARPSDSLNTGNHKDVTAGVMADGAEGSRDGSVDADEHNDGCKDAVDESSDAESKEVHAQLIEKMTAALRRLLPEGPELDRIMATATDPVSGAVQFEVLEHALEELRLPNVDCRHYDGLHRILPCAIADTEDETSRDRFYVDLIDRLEVALAFAETAAANYVDQPTETLAMHSAAADENLKKLREQLAMLVSVYGYDEHQ